LVTTTKKYIITAKSKWGGRFQYNSKPNTFKTKTSARSWLSKHKNKAKKTGVTGLKIVEKEVV
jgi:hypothetical protein